MRGARRVLVLSGAGMSAESGVPTFRDAQTGLWEEFDPSRLATAEAFRLDPPFVWAWYAWRMQLVRGVEPNDGHRALAELAGLREVTISTQNVDDLHERAGSAVAAHLHGSIFALRCSDCETPYDGDLDLPAEPLLLVCEGLEKPGNLGAILRTADAAGVDAVIAADPVTDWGNPNVVRGSKGTVFSVPVATASTPQVLDFLAGRGVTLVATTPHTEVLHTQVDLAGPVAIAVGAEKTGLTASALEGATHRVRIPMVGRANSLNVATSAAIVVYEAVRQRLG